MTTIEETDRPRLLGVFAHPDDEAFCAGGTLAKYTTAGAEAMVVSFTRGEAGQIRNAGAATRGTLGQVRELELGESCRRLGVQNVSCLDYADGRLADIDSRTIVGEIVQTIRTFRPDIVFTFGEDDAYGDPDHAAIGVATTAACRIAGDPDGFPGQIEAGLHAYSPGRLYHSLFPRNRLRLMDHLVRWLKERETRFQGSLDFVNGLTLFTSESSTMGYNSDQVNVGWYPPGLYIVEQGEPATNLYLILSGKAEVLREEPDGSTSKLNVIGPGEFFGEDGLASGHPRNAHVVSVDSVTCLVFSPGEPANYAGRGYNGTPAVADAGTVQDLSDNPATTAIDVSDFVTQKMAAIASHRTQYPISLDMFPQDTLVEMLGREYFVKVLPNGSMETDLFSD